MPIMKAPAGGGISGKQFAKGGRFLPSPRQRIRAVVEGLRKIKLSKNREDWDDSGAGLAAFHDWVSEHGHYASDEDHQRMQSAIENGTRIVSGVHPRTGKVHTWEPHLPHRNAETSRPLFTAHGPYGYTYVFAHSNLGFGLYVKRFTQRGSHVYGARGPEQARELATAAAWGSPRRTHTANGRTWDSPHATTLEELHGSEEPWAAAMAHGPNGMFAARQVGARDYIIAHYPHTSHMANHTSGITTSFTGHPAELQKHLDTLAHGTDVRAKLSKNREDWDDSGAGLAAFHDWVSEHGHYASDEDHQRMQEAIENGTRIVSGVHPKTGKVHVWEPHPFEDKEPYDPVKVATGPYGTAAAYYGPPPYPHSPLVVLHRTGAKPTRHYLDTHEEVAPTLTRLTWGDPRRTMSSGGKTWTTPHATSLEELRRVVRVPISHFAHGPNGVFAAMPRGEFNSDGEQSYLITRYDHSHPMANYPLTHHPYWYAHPEDLQRYLDTLAHGETK